jgi:hypothetical protein
MIAGPGLGGCLQLTGPVSMAELVKSRFKRKLVSKKKKKKKETEKSRWVQLAVKVTCKNKTKQTNKPKDPSIPGTHIIATTDFLICCLPTSTCMILICAH